MNITLSLSPQEFNALSVSLDKALSSLLEQYYFQKNFRPATHTEADDQYLYYNIILIEKLLESFQEQGKIIMKASYNNFTVEGTPQEIAMFFSAIEQGNTSPKNTSEPRKITAQPKQAVLTTDPKSSVSAALNFNKKTSSKVVVATYPNQDNSITLTQEADNFLKALYYYEPTRDSATGRGALVAKLILSGKPFSTSDLMKQTKSQLPTIRKTILRLRAAGCTVYVSTPRISSKKTIVQMTSMGTIEQAKQVYQSTTPSGGVAPELRYSNSPIIIPE